LISVGLLFKVAASLFHNSPLVYEGVPTIITAWLITMPKISLFIFSFKFMLILSIASKISFLLSIISLLYLVIFLYVILVLFRFIDIYSCRIVVIDKLSLYIDDLINMSDIPLVIFMVNFYLILGTASQINCFSISSLLYLVIGIYEVLVLFKTFEAYIEGKVEFWDRFMFSQSVLYLHASCY
jgi:hypothetical protein